MKMPKGVYLEFGALLAFGLAVLLLVPFGYYFSECRSYVPRHKITQQTESERSAPTHNADKAIVTDQNESADYSDDAQTDQNDGPPLCGTRTTDVLLVFFTYCLVVVGWTTVRSNDRTVRDIERARIYGGPNLYWFQIVAPNRCKLGIGFSNQGKTPGFIRELVYDWSFPEPSGPAVYTAPKREPHNNAVPPGFNAGQPFAWVEVNAATETFYCFGYFVYEDVFGGWHESRYCTEIDPVTRSQKVGGSADWNLEITLPEMPQRLRN